MKGNISLSLVNTCKKLMLPATNIVAVFIVLHIIL